MIFRITRALRAGYVILAQGRRRISNVNIQQRFTGGQVAEKGEKETKK